MTPNHDHATLFVASPLATELVDPPQPAVDDDAETMRRLRDPFAVRTLEAAAGGHQRLPARFPPMTQET